MKTTIKNFALGLAGAIALGACTDLDETVYSDMPMDNFFKNEKRTRGQCRTRLHQNAGLQRRAEPLDTPAAGFRRMCRACHQHRQLV